jgi:dihydroxyacid dehydratase/phosphogluconate dehydratase
MSTFIMNPGILINSAPGTRAGGMLSSVEEPDTSTIDVDALLAETSEAEVERKQIKLVKEAKAQNAVNTLQKVTFIHICMMLYRRSTSTVARRPS